MKGTYIHEGASTLELLAAKISEVTREQEAKGMYLDDWIGMVDREHLKRIMKDEKKKSKEKRSPFYERYATLLKDKRNRWFSTFHVSPKR